MGSQLLCAKVAEWGGAQFKSVTCLQEKALEIQGQPRSSCPKSTVRAFTVSI